MSFTDYALPQIPDAKNVCFTPKLCQSKLLIKFIRNSTYIGRIAFWQIRQISQ